MMLYLLLELYWYYIICLKFLNMRHKHVCVGIVKQICIKSDFEYAASQETICKCTKFIRIFPWKTIVPCKTNQRKNALIVLANWKTFQTGPYKQMSPFVAYKSIWTSGIQPWPYVCQHIGQWESTLYTTIWRYHPMLDEIKKFASKKTEATHFIQLLNDF